MLVCVEAVRVCQALLRAAAMAIQDGSEIGTGATRLNYRNDMHFENIVAFVTYVIVFFLFALAEPAHCLPRVVGHTDEPYAPRHGPGRVFV